MTVPRAGNRCRRSHHLSPSPPLFLRPRPQRGRQRRPRVEPGPSREKGSTTVQHTSQLHDGVRRLRYHPEMTGITPSAPSEALTPSFKAYELALKNQYNRMQFALVLGAIYIVGATIVTSQAWMFWSTNPVIGIAFIGIVNALTIRAVQLRLRDAVDGATVRRGATLVVGSTLVTYVLLTVTLTILPISIGSVITIPLALFLHLLYFVFPLTVCGVLILCLSLPSASLEALSPRRSEIEPPKITS